MRKGERKSPPFSDLKFKFLPLLRLSQSEARNLKLHPDGSLMWVAGAFPLDHLLLPFLADQQGAELELE